MAGRGSTATQGGLGEQDVAAVREEVSAGRTVTVWFTSAAVGVPTGGSAKVLGLGDVAEGDFIQVRPAGSRDAVFCSPSELTRSKPARRAPARSKAAPAAEPAEAPAPPERPVRARRAVTAEPPATEPPATGAPAAEAPVTRAPAAPARSAPTRPAPVPEGPAAAAKPAPARPRKRGERSGALTVTLAATAEGDWTVEVQAGGRRVVSSTPVAPADVAAVSRALPPAAAEVVASALADARRRQEERVAKLREELDAAERTLNQLGGD